MTTTLLGYLTGVCAGCQWCPDFNLTQKVTINVGGIIATGQTVIQSQNSSSPSYGGAQNRAYLPQLTAPQTMSTCEPTKIQQNQAPSAMDISQAIDQQHDSIQRLQGYTSSEPMIYAPSIESPSFSYPVSLIVLNVLKILRI